jgi:hypothetical protein
LLILQIMSILYRFSTHLEIQTMKKILLLSIAACSLLSACKKENEYEPATPYELIAEKKWELVSFKTNSFDLDVEAISGLDKCVKDNRWTFTQGYQLFQDEGESKCAEEHPQTKTEGSWRFTDVTNKQILFTDASFGIIDDKNLVYDVLELKANSLILRCKSSASGKATYYTYGFKH